jgi:hypothetical protein
MDYRIENNWIITNKTLNILFKFPRCFSLSSGTVKKMSSILYKVPHNSICIQAF